MTIQDVTSAMVDQNKTSFQASAKRRIGKLFNDKLVSLIKPKLPMMVKGYVDTEIGRYVLTNLFAAALIKFGYNHDKLILLAEAGIDDATDQFLGSFNIEEIINELIDGFDTTGLTTAKDTVKSGAGTILRKTAKYVDPEEAA